MFSISLGLYALSPNYGEKFSKWLDNDCRNFVANIQKKRESRYLEEEKTRAVFTIYQDWLISQAKPLAVLWSECWK